MLYSITNKESFNDVGDITDAILRAKGADYVSDECDDLLLVEQETHTFLQSIVIPNKVPMIFD